MENFYQKTPWSSQKHHNQSFLSIIYLKHFLCCRLRMSHFIVRACVWALTRSYRLTLSSGRLTVTNSFFFYQQQHTRCHMILISGRRESHFPTPSFLLEVCLYCVNIPFFLLLSIHLGLGLGMYSRRKMVSRVCLVLTSTSELSR